MYQVLKGGQRLRIGREVVVTNPSTLSKDDLADVTGLAVSIGEDAFKRSPVRVAHALAWWQPDAMLGADRHYVLEMQFFQFADKIAAFAIQAIGQHHLKTKAEVAATRFLISTASAGFVL